MLNAENWPSVISMAKRPSFSAAHTRYEAIVVNSSDMIFAILPTILRVALSFSLSVPRHMELFSYAILRNAVIPPKRKTRRGSKLCIDRSI